tara:strand:- start:49 stop:1302 length:1254 start_codon:yes stop_codon:yes gene_type:complete
MSETLFWKNKRILAWSLYDFANQPFSTIVITFLYGSFFVDEISKSPEDGTVMWSYSIAITAILVALLSPILGSIADRSGLRKFFLVSCTIICSISTMLLYFPTYGDVYFALTLFIIANIFFELGSVFCNSYLPDLTDSKNTGVVSGFAWGLGFIGGLIALFFSYIFFDLNNSIEIRQVNIFVGLWFLFFSMPVFFFLNSESIKTNKNLLKDSILEIKTTFKLISEYKIIFQFLISRLFFNDGLITIFGLGGIYALTTLNFSFNEIVILGVILNIFAALGSFVFGYIEDRIGVKKVINISLLVLIFSTLIAYIAPETGYPKQLFWIAAILIGLMVGPNQSCSRSLMSKLIPSNKKNEFFGFFSFTGKVTAFIGPFLFGLITDLYSQQAALWVVIFLFLIGFILFNQIRFNSLNSQYEI